MIEYFGENKINLWFLTMFVKKKLSWDFRRDLKYASELARSHLIDHVLFTLNEILSTSWTVLAIH